MGNKQSTIDEKASPVEVNIHSRWSKAETAKLEQMKVNLEKELGERKQMPDLIGDRRLLRFLRGHGGNVEKACEAFVNFLKFRDQYNVDEIRNEILFGRFKKVNQIKRPFDFPSGRKILGLIHQIVCSPIGHDKWENPLSTLHLGFNLDELLNTIVLDELKLFMIYALEYKTLMLEQISHDQEVAFKARQQTSQKKVPAHYGKLVGCYCILDFSGLENSWNDSRSEIVKTLLELTGEFYPELNRRYHFINIPYYFNSIWNANIKPYLEANAQSKLTVSDECDSLKKLLVDIDYACLPNTMGGDFTGYNDEFIFDLTETGPFYYKGCECTAKMRARMSNPEGPDLEFHGSVKSKKCDKEAILRSNDTPSETPAPSTFSSKLSLPESTPVLPDKETPTFLRKAWRYLVKKPTPIVNAVDVEIVSNLIVNAPESTGESDYVMNEHPTEDPPSDIASSENSRRRNKKEKKVRRSAESADYSATSAVVPGLPASQDSATFKGKQKKKRGSENKAIKVNRDQQLKSTSVVDPTTTSYVTPSDADSGASSDANGRELPPITAREELGAGDFTEQGIQLPFVTDVVQFLTSIPNLVSFW